MDAQSWHLHYVGRVHAGRALTPEFTSVGDVRSGSRRLPSTSLRPGKPAGSITAQRQLKRAPGLAVAIIAALAHGSGTAAAQDLLSIQVTPLRVELTLKPGASHTQAVTLKNEGPKAVRVRARVDFWNLSRDGTPQFTFADPAHRYSATEWVRLNPPEQVITPGATGIVRFTTSVPAGVKDAGYRGAVMFEFERPDADPVAKAREVTFRGRVATLLYATVGSPTPAVELVDLQSRVLPNRPPEVVATLKNTGPVHARTRGSAVVYDASGKPLRQLAVPNAPVLPETERELAIPTANEGEAPLAPGTYRVEVKLDLGMRELLVGETTLEVPGR
jgi:P pilus assembly chaperone PapD